MKIYLFGPMRGLPDWNFPAFDAARERLEKLGHEVFCPASLFRAMPYVREESQDRRHLVHVISQDLLCIQAADGLAGLPGWEDSAGSTVEVSMALFLNLPIFCAVKLHELEIIRNPWYARYCDCPPYPKPRGRRLDSPERTRLECRMLKIEE
jgi:hypothetical protein